MDFYLFIVFPCICAFWMDNKNLALCIVSTLGCSFLIMQNFVYSKEDVADSIGAWK